MMKPLALFLAIFACSMAVTAQPANTQYPSHVDTLAPDSIAEFNPPAPNPAQDEVLFSWMIKTSAPVTLNVTDIQGKISITLPLGTMEAGAHNKTFSTSALSDGLYLATLYIGRKTYTQRLVVTH